MTRPLRIEYQGALYHVTSRGDHKDAIYRDDVDRLAWLNVVELVCQRFHVVVHAYCMMTNHYHMLLETEEGNLSQAMRQLNGIYTQHFNRRHRRVGHVFQGRYHAVVVHKETHLLELVRYVVLNPLRAGGAASVADWPWSSYNLVAGNKPPPAWLDTDWTLSQFASDRAIATKAYEQFVAQGIGLESPLKNTRHRLFLGDDAFVTGHRAAPGKPLRDVTRVQRRAVVLSLQDYQERHPDRAEAMTFAYYSTAFTMQQIGDHFGVSPRVVSRQIRQFESSETGRTKPTPLPD